MSNGETTNAKIERARKAAKKLRSDARKLELASGGKKTPNEEIIEWQTRRISQKSAAWLIGVNASTLRDRVQITPDENGEYTVEQVVRWVAEQPSSVEDDSLPTIKARLEVRRLENQVRDQDAEFHLKASNLVERQYIKSKLERVADALRTAGERVARKTKLTGRQAQQLYNSALDKLIREIKGL